MPDAQPRIRRRATEACTFCRKRKIKCNGQRPSCINCQTYEKECVYEPVPDVSKAEGRQRHQRLKSKSVKARTASPSATVVPGSSVTGESEADSSQQRRRSHDGGSSNDAKSTTAAPSARQQSWDSPASQPMDPGVARLLVLANGESSYHGRTSALFEDNAQDQERPVEQESNPRMPDHWVERGLIAEAAKQRQLEDIHYSKGQLDFDGVDPDLGMHLLSLHWNRQHHSFLITYRPAFMRDMASGGPYFSKLLLNAIYFGSSKFSPRLEVRKDPNDVRTAGWRYRERVRELLGGSLDRSDITTIQALLVMTNSLFALGDERSAAWLYAGLAFRMLIDLGLHVDLTNSQLFSDEDLEIRRRVFWSAFVVDKIQSLYQGRPVTLKEADAMVPIKFVDTYSELEFWQPFAYSTLKNNYTGSPAYSISTFTALCKLSIVMSDIMSCIYTVRTTEQNPGELSKMLDKLQRKLREWQDALPDHLKPEVANQPGGEVPPPHVLSLHAMYNVLVILLHRPFVADGHLYNTFRSISVDSVIKCSAAASSICGLLRAYHRAFSVRRAPYLISYATYVAATIHCRIAAKNGKGSTSYLNLMTCLAVFKENQETNSAVQKAAGIIHRLMSKYGVVVEDVPDDALEAEPATKTRDQQPQPQQRLQNQVDNFEGLPNTSNTRNTETSPQDMPTVEVNSTSAVPSPGSDWINIDGIIQSFLRDSDPNMNNDLTPYGPNQNQIGPQFQPPKIPQDGEHYLHQQQPVYFPANNFPAGMNPNPNPVMEMEWGQNQYWSSNQDAAFLEDPIFGFNGSNSGEFQYMGR
ncbi:fungal-specific transcription factor domain-containing protein [Fusarium flagelliforme]|uniref:fungal-specific transcription factor domain-containing protein n=1 Tax=Fusarium flagelliforme TaxID=2675880 RepID=UPI001E8E040B|nr:fungal-specific transcription factor domain-containing protein [Fusarium flagelliforme]KAH7173958.1 fungal-specific transcription factor domain-containing protein [Fusarium flagelliforme]